MNVPVANPSNFCTDVPVACLDVGCLGKVALELFQHVYNPQIDSDLSSGIIIFIILYRVNVRFVKPPAPAC